MLAAENAVSSASTGNLIVPERSTDHVVAAASLNLVGAATSDDDVPTI
jgi:hypothetical protein